MFEGHKITTNPRRLTWECSCGEHGTEPYDTAIYMAVAAHLESTLTPA